MLLFAFRDACDYHDHQHNGQPPRYRIIWLFILVYILQCRLSLGLFLPKFLRYPRKLRVKSEEIRAEFIGEK